jgi:DNA polymerase
MDIPQEDPLSDRKGGMKRQMELRKRLGVRYVALRKSVPAEGGAPAPVREPVVPVPASPPDPEPEWLLLPGPSGGRSPEVLAKAEALRALRKEICGCQSCPLGRTRIRFVFGMGDPGARVLFVGEAPGADEDAQGLPFVGRAGQLLTKIIESTGAFKRNGVFIANVLKCRPPGNRTPQPEEVGPCLPHLRRQIAILKPALIMALGASAAQALLSTKEAVGKLRNRWHELEGVPMLVTYHPAALLRFEGYKKEVWKDMKEFTAKYREIFPD